MEYRRIEKAAVLGAGVMGSRIAAHLANVGIQTHLLDIVPPKLTPEEEAKGLTLKSPEVRNRFALKGKTIAIKDKPTSAFYVKSDAYLVIPGNIEDDFQKVSEVDIVIEAVKEDLKIKKSVFKKVDQYRKPGTIVATNTSGLPVNEMAEGLSDDFKKYFLVTHFFNPPRHLRLLELVPSQWTSPEVMEFVKKWGELILGKGIVVAKNTPNFVANRIGGFAMGYTLKVTIDDGYTVEEVDKITGPAMLRPKSATFKTIDLVGIDLLIEAGKHSAEALPHDEARDMITMPKFMEEMVKKNWLGNKTKQGFYKKTKDKEGKKQTLVLDYNKLEYREQAKVRIPSLGKVKDIDDPRKRIRELIYADDKAGAFAWKTLSRTLIYAGNRIPEISDNVVDIDNAMKWGWFWELGPFEIWDAIGVEKSVEKMRQEKLEIPESVEKMLKSGKKSFYEKEDGKTLYFNFPTTSYKPVPERPRVMVLENLKDQKKVVFENPDASLIDLGDGIACLEFHSKMNAVGAGTVEMMFRSIDEVEKRFDGLVIGNQGEHFSAGANIMMVLMAAEAEDWKTLDEMINTFQNANLRIKYCPKPIVVAPFAYTFGGGCEMCLAAPFVRAAAETYVGQVEIGVGVVPAGGGCKELVAQHMALVPPTADPFPFLRRAFELAMAKVATSAREAIEIGLFRPSTQITINKDHLIYDAKQLVLGAARAGYVPPRRKKITVMGRDSLGSLVEGVRGFKQANYVTEHDFLIGKKIAYILSGGDVARGTEVPEQYLLDLEREAFLSLCGEEKTKDRIRHMLATGQPLRN